MSDEDDFSAAALEHRENNNSRIVARGKGEKAQQIVDIAIQNKIPILEEFYLSKQLESVPLGTDIPDNLFLTLSQVLEYMHRMHERTTDELE